MTQKKIDPLVLAFQKDLNTFKFNATRNQSIADEKYYRDFSDAFQKHQIAIGEKHPKTYENGMVKVLMVIAKHRRLLFEKRFESPAWYGIKIEAIRKLKQKASTLT